MKNFYLLIVFCFCFLQSYAQENNFYVKERFFEGKKVKLFSENRGGAVVLFADNSIHLMDKDFQFTDVTHFFQPAIIEDISSVESVNERIFLVGTKGNSLFMYDEGEVTNLQELNPDLPDQINSIDFNTAKQGEETLLGTNDSLWISNNLKNFGRSSVKLSANPRFYGGREVMLVDSKDGFGCHDVSSEYSILYNYIGNSSMIFKLFQNEDFDLDKLYDIEFGRYTGYSGVYGVYAYYAAHNGIYAKSLYDCNLDTVVRVTNVAVHDLKTIKNQGLNRTAMLAASDTGLFYNEVDQYGRMDVYQDSIVYTVEGIDSAYTINYSIFHNTIWVGTDNGLVRVHDDNLTPASLEPESIATETVRFCQDQGAYLRVDIHSQIDKQWFKNGQEIAGAISSVYIAQEEALYSIEYNYNDSLYYYDVANTQLEDRFNETIRKQEYLICQDDYGKTIYVDNSNYYSHDYSWYSVERGLEFETANSSTNHFHTTEAGHFYFIATNCNGFTYHSDTVEVNKSSLGEETFSMVLDQDLCVGDTVFVENSETVTQFEWDISNHDLEGYNERYIVLKTEYSEDYLSLRMIDEYGCVEMLYASIGWIYPLPNLSEDQEEIYICEEEEFVYLDLDEGLTADWAGYTEGTEYMVSPGIYPVTISNGVCPDYNVDIEIKYFDPFPILNFEDTVVQVGDTFKIPTNGYFGINWEGEIQLSSDQSYLYLTSDVADTLQSELWFSSPDCEQLYSFTIFFEGSPILNVDSHDKGFRIYPNPTKKGVTIDQAKSTIECIQLLNLDGRIMDTKYFHNASSLYFDFPSHLEAGTYFIRIKDINNQIVTRKIVLE